MPGVEIELNPIDFITIGTIGPKGQRVFYLQAGYNNRIISLIIEKEQSWALSEAIRELIDDLDERSKSDEFDDDDELPAEDEDSGDDADSLLPAVDMDLREPIEPVFRVSQMGLGYDEEQDKIVLVAQELVIGAAEEDDAIGSIDDENQPGVVRFWCSRDQMRALSEQAMQTVQSGRADPKQNGRLVYYWT